MSYTLYILRCNDGTYYIGSTNNLEKRLREHNGRKNGAKYTRMRRPVVVQYQETYETLSEVRKREAALKKLSRPAKEKLWQK